MYLQQIFGWVGNFVLAPLFSYNSFSTFLEFNTIQQIETRICFEDQTIIRFQNWLGTSLKLLMWKLLSSLILVDWVSRQIFTKNIFTFLQIMTYYHRYILQLFSFCPFMFERELSTSATDGDAKFHAIYWSDRGWLDISFLPFLDSRDFLLFISIT